MLKDVTKFYSEADIGDWIEIILANSKLHYYKKYLRPKNQLDLFAIRGKVYYYYYYYYYYHHHHHHHLPHCCNLSEGIQQFY